MDLLNFTKKSFIPYIDKGITEVLKHVAKAKLLLMFKNRSTISNTL